ncbi:MAG: hypothetical protein WCB27_24445 [Thermoguttaceae bacterium]|jgi:hypothetical protein
MSSDFHFTAEQIQRARRMTPQERFAEMRRLTTEGITAERQAIARANPQLNEQEVNLLWMERTYGKDIADGVRQDLENRKKSRQDA